MNRRFFLKLFPAASAVVAIPSVVALASPKRDLPDPDTLSEKWHGDGYYDVLDGRAVQILSVVRWSAYDNPDEGRCFRFDPRMPFSGGEIVYRYEAALDAALVRKVGEF
ncbi:MAG TPA: hypothetical protein VN150_07940 [Ochrobactrum sp.]|nr:hypothetical protein [Ochrobactrum sp.]